MVRRKKSEIISRLLSNISEQNKREIHNKMMIACKISDAIKDKGMTQKEFAIKMNTTQQRVSEWECNKVEPSLYNIIKIIKILNTTFEELADGIE
jgi:DNA-binding transcriptional regulator YiaG